MLRSTKRPFVCAFGERWAVAVAIASTGASKAAVCERATSVHGPDFARGVPVASHADGTTPLGHVGGEAVLLIREVPIQHRARATIDTSPKERPSCYI